MRARDVGREEVYLGDGLYASFDGFMILLRAPRRHEDHWVGLEPEVYEKLVEFARDRWKPPPKDLKGAMKSE
jgi:hypothetical protein